MKLLVFHLGKIFTFALNVPCAKNGIHYLYIIKPLPMKKIIIPCMILLLASCAETNFYQVYKTNFNDGNLTKDKIVFEDNNCSVSYNLWSEGGNMGFAMYNKTENYLIVNLAKTFFVLNGMCV